MRNADEMVQTLLDRVATAQLSRRRFLILAAPLVSPPTQTTYSEKERRS